MVRVFFVDDEISIRKGLEKIISWEEYGVEVVGEAANGEEALLKLIQIRTDIIITDVKMPIMNGLEMVKKIKSIYKNIKIIIISGYDDFEYVKEALMYGVESYLTKPINEEELSNTIINCVEKIESEKKLAIKQRQDAEVIRNNLVYRLMKNMISQSEIFEKADYLNIDAKAKQYQVSIIKIILDENKKSDMNIYKFSIINICNEILSIALRCNIIGDYEGNVIIVFFDDDLKDKQERIRRLLQKSIDNIIKIFKIGLFISLGSIQYKLLETYKSFDIAMKLMDYAYVCPANSIKTYDEANKEINKIKDLQNYHLEELVIMIKKGDLNYVNHFYDVVLNSPKSLSPESLYNLVVQILIDIIELSKKNELELDQIIGGSENLYAYLFKDVSIDIMLNRIKQISIRTTQKFIEIQNKPKSLVLRIIDLINEHYNEEISLKTMSNTFNINSAYLGQLVKKECGMMFTDYLNNTRITVAKSFLLETEMSSNEISTKVGYNNSNYFYRVFKKYTGLYPTEYREKYRNKIT